MLSTGYVDPTLKGVSIDQNTSASNTSGIHKGTITITTPVVGSHKICLQTHGNKR